MKKILSVALSTAMAFSMFANVAFGDTATLTPQDKFNALQAKGILNGYPDGQAHLEKDLTRAEFAKIVTKLFDLKEVSNKLSYKDKGYNATNWAVPYIEAVTEAKLMQGKDTVKGIFDYNGKVTVEEVSAVLFRALKLETPETTDNSASAWAKGYAQAVINAGLGFTKDTNFKANATRSQVVVTAYAIDQQTAKPAVTSIVAESPTSVKVTFADKGELTVTLTTALVQGVETPVTFKYKDHDYSEKVTLAAPKVVSVEAPNGKQLVVKFNRAVDKSTVVRTVDKKEIPVKDIIEIKEVAGAKPVTEEAALVSFSDDSTVVTFTAPNTEVFEGQYAVTLKKGVKTTANEEIDAYTQLITVKDTVAPTFVSATAVAKTTTNQVVIKLSEPVLQTGVIAYVDGASAAVQPSLTISDEIVLTTNTLTSGKSYEVSLLNVKDFAGNAITPNPYKTQFTVVSDVAGPVVKSITVDGEKNIKIEFDKAVKTNTFSNNARLLDANSAQVSLYNYSSDSNGGKTVILTPATPSNIAFGPNNNYTGTFVLGTGVQDTLTNPLAAAVSQSVTFTKDVVAPSVTKVTYTDKGVVVTFSENIQSNVANDLTTDITLISDATGSIVSTNKPAKFTAKDKELTIPYALGAGSYTLRLPAELVKDFAGSPNKSAASLHNFTASAIVTSDTSQPEFGWVDDKKEKVVATGPSEFKKGKEQTVSFVVYDANGLDYTTVIEGTNYTLDNKALPAGTYITTNRPDNSKTDSASNPATVTLHIPASGLTETKDSYVLVISNIKDKAGNTAGPQVTTGFKLYEGVKPVLNSAAIASADSTSLVLGFTEAVRNAEDAKNYEFTINGKVVNQSAVNITRGTGSDAGKYLVTFKTIGKTEVNADNKTVNKLYFLDADGAEIYLADATQNTAGTLDLNASYVNNISVKIKEDKAATTAVPTPFVNSIVDLADGTADGNAVVTGTSINVR